MDNKDHKIYLNTVEEIVDALQKGEAVYEDITGGNIKYKIYNGVMVSEYSQNGSKFVNSGTIFEEKNRYYILKKAPLKIEVGKFYKLAKETKAFIYSKEPDGTYQAVEVGDSGYFEVSEDGKSKDDCPNYDIVDYWED